MNHLLERCSPLLDAFLRRRVGGRLNRFVSLADLRQDILLRGVRALSALDSEATVADFEALLLQHAGWAIKNAARKHNASVGESVAHGAEGVPDRAPVPKSAEGTVTRADERRWVLDLLSELSDAHRSVVERRLARKTFAEIGAELGIGEDAARKRFLAASDRLRGLSKRGSRKDG